MVSRDDRRELPLPGRLVLPILAAALPAMRSLGLLLAYRDRVGRGILLRLARERSESLKLQVELLELLQCSSFIIRPLLARPQPAVSSRQH